MTVLFSVGKYNKKKAVKTTNFKEKAMNAMSRGTLAKRIAVCLFGAAVNAAGVCLMAKTALGASPVTSLPLALSLSLGMTQGLWTILFFCVLVAAQRIFIGREFTVKSMVLQVLLTIVYGLFIDMWAVIYGDMVFESYAARILFQAFGCILLAAGVSAMVMSEFTMLPGEGGVKIVTKFIRCEFGNAKIIFDCLCVISAIVVCLICSGSVAGVREGTAIAVLFTGSFSKMFMRRTKEHLERFFTPALAAVKTGVGNVAAGAISLASDSVRLIIKSTAKAGDSVRTVARPAVAAKEAVPAPVQVSLAKPGKKVFS